MQDIDKEEFGSCVVNGSVLVLSSKVTFRAYVFLELNRIHVGVLGRMDPRLASCLHRSNLSGSIEIRIDAREVSPVFCLTETVRAVEESEKEKQALIQELVISAERKAEEFKGIYESVYDGLVVLQRIVDPKDIVTHFLRPKIFPAPRSKHNDPPSREGCLGESTETILQIVCSEEGILNETPLVDKLSNTLTSGIVDLSIIFEPVNPARIQISDRQVPDFFSKRFREACRLGAWNSRLYIQLNGLPDNDMLGISSLKSRIKACLSQRTDIGELRGNSSSRERAMRVVEVPDRIKASREILLREVEGRGEMLTSSELSCFLYPYDLGSKRSYRLLSTPMKAPSQQEFSSERGEKIPIGLILDCMERPVGRFEISKRQMKRHLCILGVTGSGKTTTGLTLALELSKAKVPVVILDRTGEYTKTLPKFSPLAETLTLGEDLVIPPFEFERDLELDEQIEEWTETVEDYVEVTWGETLSPTQNRTLRLALQECRDRGSGLTISNLIKELRNPGEAVKRIKWWSESSESIISRLEIFTAGRCKKVFDTEQSHLEMTSLFYPFISIVDLSFFTDDRPKNLFSQLFSRKLEKHVRKMGETPELRLVYLIDEAQHIAPQRAVTNPGLRMGVVERFAVELRKYGVGLITMSTRPTMISKNILANSNTIINHCLFYEDDVKRMRQTLGLESSNELDWKGAEQCLRTLDPGKAIVRYSPYKTPFLVRIRTLEHGELLSETANE